MYPSLRSFADAFSDHIKLALKVEFISQLWISANKDLANHWSRQLCSRAKCSIVDGHRAPAEHGLTFLAYDLFKQFFALLSPLQVFRQKHHADTIKPGRRQSYGQLLSFACQKQMGNLQEEAGPASVAF